MWDRSGNAFFVADDVGNISVFNGTTLKPQPEIVLNGLHRRGSKVACIAMHPSNEFFVSGGNDALLAFWDFEDLLCTGTVEDNQHSVKTVGFSPCGNFLAAICQDDRIESD